MDGVLQAARALMTPPTSGWSRSTHDQETRGYKNGKNNLPYNSLRNRLPHLVYDFLIVFLVVVILVLAFVNPPLAWPGDPTRTTRCPWPMLFPATVLSGLLATALAGFLATALAGFFVVVRIAFVALPGAWLDNTPGKAVPQLRIILLSRLT